MKTKNLETIVDDYRNLVYYRENWPELTYIKETSRKGEKHYIALYSDEFIDDSNNLDKLVELVDEFLVEME